MLNVYVTGPSISPYGEINEIWEQLESVYVQYFIRYVSMGAIICRCTLIVSTVQSPHRYMTSIKCLRILITDTPLPCCVISIPGDTPMHNTLIIQLFNFRFKVATHLFPPPRDDVPCGHEQGP